MPILVMNCDHWIGFHLVERLLELGYQVHGVAEEEKDDYLTHFFGRNSRFAFVTSTEEIVYDACFMISEMKENQTIQTDQMILIDDRYQFKKVENKHAHIIRPPLLYGEWMPMTKDSVYYADRWINIHSEQFKKDGVYIKNFVDSLLQLMHIKNLPSYLNIYTKLHLKAFDSLHHTIYIRESGNDREKVKKVIAHHEKIMRFKNLKL